MCFQTLPGSGREVTLTPARPITATGSRRSSASSPKRASPTPLRWRDAATPGATPPTAPRTACRSSSNPRISSQTVNAGLKLKDEAELAVRAEGFEVEHRAPLATHQAGGAAHQQVPVLPDIDVGRLVLEAPDREMGGGAGLPPFA